MVRNIFKCKTKVWLYPGMAGWHFVTIPVNQGKEIKKNFGKIARGFGSLRIRATVGKTSWDTSVFPDKKSGSYLLPIKAKIRKKEKIEDRSNINVAITIKI